MSNSSPRNHAPPTKPRHPWWTRIGIFGGIFVCLAFWYRFTILEQIDLWLKKDAVHVDCEVIVPRSYPDTSEIPLRVKVTNHSSKLISWGYDKGRPYRYFSLYDSYGMRVPYTDQMQKLRNRWGARYGYSGDRVPPGSSHENTYDLKDYYDIQGPGMYTLRARALILGDGEKRIAESKPVTVKIVEP